MGSFEAFSGSECVSIDLRGPQLAYSPVSRDKLNISRRRWIFGGMTPVSDGIKEMAPVAFTIGA